jgi:hypothetical protein
LSLSFPDAAIISHPPPTPTLFLLLKKSCEDWKLGEEEEEDKVRWKNDDNAPKNGFLLQLHTVPVCFLWLKS